MEMQELSLEKFEEASEIVKKVTQETKLIYSEYFSERYGNKIYFKPENMQRTGAYKVRGAYYKISQLSPEERSRGLITASAGNHAQGVAYAAKLAGVKATVVMPVTTPLIKVNRTKSYGADVVLYGNVFDEACAHAYELADEHGYTFVHPFNDLEVATGQGSIAMEIIKELPTVDYILVPVGGGGLCTGVSTLAKLLNPKIKVIAVEPTGAACLKELIRMYCFIQPDFYHYCWSRSAQQSWKRMDATSAQRGKLQFTLKQQGIRVTDKSDLNKLDASTLIDWAMRYKKARKMSEAFVQASSGKQTKKATAAVNTVEGLLNEQEAFCGPADESAFRLFMDTVRARYAAVCESIREMEEAKQAAFKKAMETSELRVPFSVQISKGQSFTDAQLSMLTSLEHQIGIFMDFRIETLTRRQASLAISFLMMVRNMPSEIRDAVEFPDAKQVCLSAEKTEATVFVFRQVPKKKEKV